MAEMPKRDTAGNCEGECKDRVAKMERENQEEMKKAGGAGSTAETPSVEHAKQRDRAPGDLGGHV